MINTTLTPDQFAAAGRALFGERWQADLTEALGLRDTSRIRQMLTGRRRIPPGVVANIIDILRQRAAAMQAMADALD